MRHAGQVELTIVPATLRQANALVQRLHRHHQPLRACCFCLAVTDGARVRGVAIVGRPVARKWDDGRTLEVARVATDGCPNACSALYGAARRAAKALGYGRLVTYTLPEEGGASLRGAGWVCEGVVDARSWDNVSRGRVRDPAVRRKWRWTTTWAAAGRRLAGAEVALPVGRPLTWATKVA